MNAAPGSPTLAMVLPLHDPGERLDTILFRLAVVAPLVDRLVIVDDGSPATVRERLEEWAGDYPTVLVEILPENVGVAGARNRALELVDTDYVWFVDDDDEWDPNALAVIGLYLTTRPDVLAFRAEYRYRDGVDGRIVDGLEIDGVTTGGDALRSLMAGEIHGFLWSKVFKRSVLPTPLFPALSSQSDVVGVARAFAEADSVRFIPHVLYTYVRRPRSITRIATPNFDNLVFAYDDVVAAASSRTDIDVDLATRDYFAAWFYCSAVLRTLARQNVASDARTAALRQARTVASTLGLRGIARRSLGQAGVMLALRAAPGLALLSTRMAYAVLDGARSLRGRRRPVVEPVARLASSFLPESVSSPGLDPAWAPILERDA